MDCLDETTIALFVDRLLRVERVAEIEAHIDVCATCRRVLSALARGHARPRVDTIDRYVLVRVIGSGAMGAVYAGYDPTLDRKVAIKLLRRAAASAESQLRLVREAQAMARVSSPNVVAVYDAGTLEDQVYIVMELVGGATLRSWLVARPRTWRETVRVFEAAARGLAAAHARGLVHRDFKPDNVLVDGDHVRVADFGLAASIERDAARDSKPIVGPASSLELSMTATGAAVGTPAYMAPEQLAGGDADARSDQFAFCVALYEALERARPFAGDSAPALGDAIRAGRIRPHARALPRWLRAAIARGLAADPGARHASMDALLAEVGRARGRTRRWLAAGAAAAVAGVAAWSLARSAHGGPTCRGFDDQLAGVWNPSRGAALARQLAATGSPYAAAASAELVRVVDRYTADWVAMRTETCEATRVRGEQSERMLDLGAQCLDRRRDGLAALLDGLASADAAAVAKAVTAVHELEPIATCGDRAALEAGATTRSWLASSPIAAQLATARTAHMLGRYAQSQAIASGVLAIAHAVGARDVEIEAMLVLAATADKRTDWALADQLYRDAANLAETIKRDDVVASMRTRRIRIAVQRARYPEAREHVLSARAAVERAGSSPAARRDLATFSGILAASEGKYEDARAQFQIALDLVEHAREPDPLALASALRNLGGSLLSLGRLAEAQAADERALALFRARFGDDHPDVAGVRVNLAQVLLTQGKYAEAKPQLEHALATFQASHGPDNQLVATTLDELADVERGLHRFEEAIELDRRALAMQLRAGADRPEVALVHSNLGDSYDSLGRYDEALAEYRASIELNEKLHGKDHPAIAALLNNLGLTLAHLHRYDEARAALQRALDINTRWLGPEHMNVGVNLAGIGQVEIETNHPALAIAPLERACTLMRAGDRVDVATCNALLAHALWDVGRERARARKLALDARAVFAAAGAGSRDALADLDAWLAAHR